MKINQQPHANLFATLVNSFSNCAVISLILLLRNRARVRLIFVKIRPPVCIDETATELRDYIIRFSLQTLRKPFSQQFREPVRIHIADGHAFRPFLSVGNRARSSMRSGDHDRKVAFLHIDQSIYIRINHGNSSKQCGKSEEKLRAKEWVHSASS